MESNLARWWYQNNGTTWLSSGGGFVYFLMVQARKKGHAVDLTVRETVYLSEISI